MAVTRTYSVTVESGASPFAAIAFSIPLHQFGVGRRSDLSRLVVSLLGVEVQQIPTPSSDEQVVSIVARVLEGALFEGPLSYRHFGGPARPHIEELAAAIVRDPYIPTESSPLSGTSVQDLVKGTSLMGFATFGEGYALVHHDTVLVVATPAVVVVIGAAVGMAEGLRERLRRAANPSAPRSSRKKS